MQLRLVREVFSDSCTHGSLYVNSVFECFTLEDALRGDGDPATVKQWKIPSKSCIPFGTYAIKLHNSPRFGRILPWLQSVPGFAFILIHSGNTAADTEGCILVGQARMLESNSVSSSRKAFEPLFNKISAALQAGEKVEIEICRNSSR